MGRQYSLWRAWWREVKEGGLTFIFGLCGIVYGLCGIIFRSWHSLYVHHCANKKHANDAPFWEDAAQWDDGLIVKTKNKP